MSAEGTRRTRVLALLLFVASAAYFASYARIGLHDDEGYLLEGVTRLLDGQVIYRDFHHTYAPGRFYLFAALFRVFGEDLLVVRTTWVVLRAAIVVLAWLVARRLIAGPLAWAPALALLAVPGPWHKSFFHLFLVAALLAGIDLFERGGGRRSLVAGLVLALALLFRQDVGIAASGAFALYLALDALVARQRRRAAAPVSIPLLLCGFIALIAPTLVYFMTAGALGPMIDKVLFAGARDNLTNDLPFPALAPILPVGAPSLGAAVALLFVKALYYFPPVTFAAYGVFLLARSIIGRALPSAGEFLLALLGGSALLQVAARSDVPHLLQAVGLVYFVWAIALSRFVARFGTRVRVALSTALLLAFPLCLTGGISLLARTSGLPEGARFLADARVTIPAVNATGAGIANRIGPTIPLGVRRARVLVTQGRADFLAELGRFLDERTERGDYILTIPGSEIFYFLFDRRNPTAFPHVRRAFDSPEEEAAYIADIERHGTRYILFQDYAIDGRPERRFAAYARSTMDWITERYRLVEEIGGIVILERIDGAT